MRLYKTRSLATDACKNGRITINGTTAKPSKTVHDGDTVTVEALMEKGLIKKALDGVKILGGGELTKKLTVAVDKVTESAKAKIEASGGKVEVK